MEYTNFGASSDSKLLKYTTLEVSPFSNQYLSKNP